MKKLKVCVLGGGSFGTALADIAANNDHATTLWLRDRDLLAEINEKHLNSRYLPNVLLSQSLQATDDLALSLRHAELIFVAIPGKYFRAVIQAAKPYGKKQQAWVSTSKGIEETNFTMMSEVLRQELPECMSGVLSGPNLAKEIAAKTITATVIASEHKYVRDVVQQSLSNQYFRVYANTDTFGVELGGALKNIYAIIAGMAAALQQGENTKSMLITRSLAEMSRFAVAMGANPLTFLGLAGVGDLVVTCTSPLSRNYRVGHALARGETLEDIVRNLGEVAEGVNTTRTIYHKAIEMGIDMPLVNGLYKIIYEKMPVDKVISQLMLRQQTSDVEFILPRQNEA